MVDIKVLATEGDYTLVEYVAASDIKRVSVPSKSLVDGKTSKNVLEHGIGYGVDWDASFPGLSNLNYEMHRRGIWNYDDAQTDLKNCRAAVAAATGKIIQAIMQGGSL